MFVDLTSVVLRRWVCICVCLPIHFPIPEGPGGTSGVGLRACVSEVAMGGLQQQYERIYPVFGMGSRSLSTWVAVGDGAAAIQISSQLPSPQGRPTSVHVDSNKAGSKAHMSQFSLI